MAKTSALALRFRPGLTVEPPSASRWEMEMPVILSTFWKRSAQSNEQACEFRPSRLDLTHQLRELEIGRFDDTRKCLSAGASEGEYSSLELGEAYACPAALKP